MEGFDKSFNAQGSPEWYEERLGKFTSSKASCLLVSSKSPGQVFGEGAWTYIYEKIYELATGLVADEFDGNDATDWGLAHEPDADEMYCHIKKLKTEECGFVKYNDAFGGSPDRLVGTDGITEIKCPKNGTNHMKFLDIESADDFKSDYKKYYTQIQGNLLATKREWCDFISFDPRPKIEPLQIKIIRIYRDAVMIKNLEDRIELGAEIIVNRFEYMIKTGLAMIGA